LSCKRRDAEYQKPNQLGRVGIKERKTHRKDHSILLQQPFLQDLLDVRLIAGLVRIDEDKVERLRLFLDELVERMLSGSDAVVDFRGDAGAVPEGGDEFLEVGLDVESDDVFDGGDEGEGELWRRAAKKRAGKKKTRKGEKRWVSSTTK
jgi:hypothetical protein